MHIGLDVGLLPPFANWIIIGKMIYLKPFLAARANDSFEILPLVDEFKVWVHSYLNLFTFGSEVPKFANRGLVRPRRWHETFFMRKSA